MRAQRVLRAVLRAVLVAVVVVNSMENTETPGVVNLDATTLPDTEFVSIREYSAGEEMARQEHKSYHLARSGDKERTATTGHARRMKRWQKRKRNRKRRMPARVERRAKRFQNLISKQRRNAKGAVKCQQDTAYCGAKFKPAKIGQCTQQAGNNRIIYTYCVCQTPCGCLSRKSCGKIDHVRYSFLSHHAMS